MLSRTQKRVVVGTAALIVIVLFVVPAINVNRYRLSVAEALSRALGREVTVQGIGIQTFPQPGLLLTGVVVADDPSISVEPMLRADEVLATFRVTSLWRGRLEISNLKLKYPSLNIVRANDGRWNLEGLLERARETPAAPTSKTRPESRARFPYIQSEGGRINLKIANEKKVFALNEADFALWLASEDEWRMRLEARPIRTDANLSDTGTLKVEGAWRRAPRLHDTPIYARVWWDDGQLGQITRLIYGRDRGWRGALTASAVVSGQPEKLQLKLDTQVDDFRRYDIASSDSVKIEAHCNAEYNFIVKALREIGCQSPAGNGVVLVHGNYALSPDADSDLSISAENIPMQYLWQLARRAKRDLPSDTTATGTLSAMLTMRGTRENRVWTGDAQTSAVDLSSTVLKQPLRLEPTHWVLSSEDEDQKVGPKKKVSKKSKTLTPHSTSLALRIKPLQVALDGSAPATITGWLSKTSYNFNVIGEAELSRLFQLGKLAGLSEPDSEVEGSAKGELRVSGDWAGFVPASLTGSAQLRNISVKVSGVSKPLRISSANFAAATETIIISNALLKADGLHSVIDASAQWPQHCNSGDRSQCALQFSVKADQLELDEINTLINPKAQKQPWYAALASSVMGTRHASFPQLFARGDITANKVIVKSVATSSFKCMAEIEPGGLRLHNVSGELFGGRYSGELFADFTGGTPKYHATATLNGVAMTNVSNSMKDGWATGTVNSQLQVDATGWSSDAIVSSAKGTAEFDWMNGTLPHVDLDGTGKALQFKRFSGTAKLTDGVVTISEGKLQNAKSIYRVSGTASLQRQVKLKLARDGAPELSISGSLARPVITNSKAAETQAQLRQTR